MQLHLFILTIALQIITPAQGVERDVVYFESWDKDDRQMQEQTFEIEVNVKHPKYSKKIKDKSGKTRYTLSIKPDRRKDKSGIVFWIVQLNKSISLKEIFFPSFTADALKPYNDPEQHVFTKEDFAGFLHPSCLYKATGKEGDRCVGLVPLFTKRVVKVQQFFCIIEVQGFSYLRGSNRALGSMKIRVKFTNSYKPEPETKQP